MGSPISSCDTCAFAPLQSPQLIERRQQEEQASHSTSQLSSNDIINNLSQQFGESAQTVQKTDGSIDYQAVQALLEINTTKQSLESHSMKSQLATYSSDLTPSRQPLGQILNISA